MQRVISAFTRVFDALWLLRRTGTVTNSVLGMAPDQQRTASALRGIRGTEARLHAALAGGARSLKSGDSRSLGSVMVCSFSSVMPGIISTT